MPLSSPGNKEYGIVGGDINGMFGFFLFIMDWTLDMDKKLFLVEFNWVVVFLILLNIVNIYECSRRFIYRLYGTYLLYIVRSY